MSTRLLFSSVSKDLEDQEHDRRVLAGELGEDMVFLSSECQCPQPNMCAWEGRTCTVCHKKRNRHPVTDKLQQIAMAMIGGMPMQREDLSMMEWQILGMIRMEMQGPVV